MEMVLTAQLLLWHLTRIAGAMQRPKGQLYAQVIEYTAADGGVTAGPAAAPAKSETIAATSGDASQM